ncbi:MAG TPA: hypothetical protein VHU21_07805 [Paraburkholderia sp.]|jgi:hypothetical protein|nr:hypothetical protein [Paraburkholderia sp.]
MVDWLNAGLPAGVPAEDRPLLGEEIRELYSGRETFADARKHDFAAKNRLFQSLRQARIRCGIGAACPRDGGRTEPEKL